MFSDTKTITKLSNRSNHYTSPEYQNDLIKIIVFAPGKMLLCIMYYILCIKPATGRAKNYYVHVRRCFSSLYKCNSTTIAFYFS